VLSLAGPGILLPTASRLAVGSCLLVSGGSSFGLEWTRLEIGSLTLVLC